MPRAIDNYRKSTVAGETVRAFVPAALPPAAPALRVESPIDAACARAMAAIGRLELAAIHLLDLLPSNPIVTVPKATTLLGTTAPTARKAVEALDRIGILRETSARQRNRVYAYQASLQTLTADEETTR
jgi:Fic family protein